MKKFTEEEKNILCGQALFLTKKGYVLCDSGEALEYANGQVKFEIYNAHLYDPCDVQITFIKEHEGFVGSWLKAVIENFPPRGEAIGCLERLTGILRCLELHYNSIMDIQFCRTCDAAIKNDPRISEEAKQLLEKVSGRL